MDRPKLKEDPDYAAILAAAQEFMDFMDSDSEYGIENLIGDEENLIVEAVLKAMYGDDVYDWINTKF